MYKLYCRAYQGAFRMISPLLPWRKPELMEGKNSLTKLPKLIKSQNIEMVIIITDKGISSIGLLDVLLKGLEEEKIS